MCALIMDALSISTYAGVWEQNIDCNNKFIKPIEELLIQD